MISSAAWYIRAQNSEIATLKKHLVTLFRNKDDPANLDMTAENQIIYFFQKTI